MWALKNQIDIRVMLLGATQPHPAELLSIAQQNNIDPVHM